MVDHGGGISKVLYTLQTARRVGLLNSAKALSSSNACKACGLGMGGQRGGMTNELDEFPSVCNKSVQAQDTDIQAPIPGAVFQHTLDEFRRLTGTEMEHLGRLGQPLHKFPGEDRFREVDWAEALSLAARRIADAVPDRTFFYSSGRSSNEAGFVFQLLARMLGTNNVTNCSYYCHQATSVALESTVGTGTATVELDDLSGCDLVFLIGANPASNHPRLLHRLIELRRRGGHVVVINPLKEPGLVRFAAPKLVSSLIKGGDEVASVYLQPRIGTDIALFSAIAKLLLESGRFDDEFVGAHTSGFDVLRDALSASSVDGLLAECRVSRADAEQVADLYARSNAAVFAWGMGMTHHAHGVSNIEWISNLALLRGMVGRRYAGLLPLRGHSNVQGIGTIGVKPVLSEEVLRRMEHEFGLSLPDQPGLDTLASLEAAHRGEMDVAVVMGGNLLEATPDRAWAEEAMSSIGTKIYLTTTLNRGHVRGLQESEAIILPVCARDEEPEPTTQESMFNYVRMSDGGIERIASVRSEASILVSLGKRLLPDAPFDFDEFAGQRRVREAIARVVPGMEALADIDVAKREFHVRGRVLHTPSFATADGRARFVVSERPPVARDAHAFVLSSIRSEGQFNSIIYEDQDSYRGVTDRWSVLMCRDDMARLGLAQGDRADVWSDVGRMAGVSVLPFDLPVGCLAAYYPEANVLVPRTADVRSRTPAFKSVRVSIQASRER